MASVKITFDPKTENGTAIADGVAYALVPRFATLGPHAGTRIPGLLSVLLIGDVVGFVRRDGTAIIEEHRDGTDLARMALVRDIALALNACGRAN